MTVGSGEEDSAEDQASAAPRRGVDLRDVGVALLTSVLILLGAFGLDRWVASQSPADMRAVGVVADPHLVAMTAIYGSFAREAAEGGGLRVHNHQTAEEHGPSQARPWDVFVGKISGLLGGGARTAFHVDRVFAALLFPLALLVFLGECVRARAVRYATLALACTGGSLYWIYAVRPDAPLRGTLAAWLDGPMGGLDGLGFAFPALLVGVPHLVLELVFLLLAASGLLIAGRRAGLAPYLLTGVSVTALCSVRPYSVPAALAFVGTVIAVRFWRCASGAERKHMLAAGALAVLPVFPLLVHYYGVVRGGGVFSGLDVYHPAPSLLEQLWFTGLTGFLALELVFPAVYRRTALGSHAEGVRDLRWLLGSWLAATMLVVHGEALPAPFTIGWEVEGMLPIPLLALIGAALVLDRPRVGGRAGQIGALLAMQFIPTVVWVARSGERVEDGAPGLVLHAEEERAFGWLEAERPADALTADRAPIVLLCDPSLAPLVPWLAGVRVWSGHPDHTVDSGRKQAQVASLLGDGNGAAALAELGVTHVLLGPRERAQRSVEAALFEERVAAWGDVVLYDSAGNPLLVALEP